MDLHEETQKLIDELQKEADLMVEWTEKGIDRYAFERIPHRIRIVELSEKIHMNLLALMIERTQKKETPDETSPE